MGPLLDRIRHGRERRRDRSDLLGAARGDRMMEVPALQRASRIGQAQDRLGHGAGQQKGDEHRDGCQPEPHPGDPPAQRHCRGERFRLLHVRHHAPTADPRNGLEGVDHVRAAIVLREHGTALPGQAAAHRQSIDRVAVCRRAEVAGRREKEAT